MRRSRGLGAAMLLAAIMPQLLKLAPNAQPQRASRRALTDAQPTRAQRGEIADWNAAVEAKRQAKLAKRKSAQKGKS